MQLQYMTLCKVSEKMDRYWMWHPGQHIKAKPIKQRQMKKTLNSDHSNE